MTTNDPAEKYGEERPKREPLLSDHNRDSSVPYAHDAYSDAWKWWFDYCRAYYERLIDEGRLKVVQEVEYIDATSALFKCSGCDILELNSRPLDKFCPGCGNPIKR